MTVPLVREVATELRSLVMHRGCGIQEFSSNILEELVWLWRLYPTDPVLYLRRCEDRAESEVAVQLDFVPDQSRPAMSADRVHHLRISRFFESVFELFGKGYTVDDLGDELEGLWAAHRGRNPYPHPTDADEDTAEYHRNGRAERKAQLEAYVEEILGRDGGEGTA